MLLTLLLTSSVSSISQDKKTENISIVATTIFPFHYMKDGKPQGIFIEISEKIFQAMGVNATFTIVDDKNALDLVKKGEYDITLSVSYNADRESYLIYPQDFESGKNFVWVSEYYFFTKKEDKAKYSATNLEALRKLNPTVGVIPGLSYAPEFWDQKFSVVEGSDDESLFKDLMDDKVDLFITDKTIGRSTLVREGLENEVVQLPIQVFSKPYTLCVGKNSSIKDPEAFLEEYFKTYDLLKKTQEARKIFFKYLKL